MAADGPDQIAVDAIVVSGPRAVRTERLFIPGPNADQLIVKVELCGLCTPEQRVYRGNRATYPYWGGHELCGVLEHVPPALDRTLRVNARVAVGLMRRCGQCAACRAGLDNHCAYLHPEPRDLLPIGPRGLSDRLVVAPSMVFPVPDTLPAEKVALAEPVACSLHSVRQAAPRKGETALVIGGGTMGLIHIVLLTLRDCRVFVVDDDAATASACEAAGASFLGPFAVLDELGPLASLTQGWGHDVVVCTRFGARAIEAASRVAARGGRIVLYQSIDGADEVRLSANLLHYRELQLIGTIAQTSADITAAIELLAAHADRFDCLSVETIPVTQPQKAFECAIQPQVNRVMLDFRH
ncbi:MAG: alcohol dehydrogenase catalytic domain-containing protein [Alphaproteobacteria bacterium]|nr:alcohol dehydrogenase catalytic domain-containing protein [Alphaproteobacteria bacterium]